jgi:RND superfamily putative drug exporter
MTAAVVAPLKSRLAVAAAWVLVAAAVLPFAPSLESRLVAEAQVAGSEHARVAALLERDFDTPLADPLILTVEGVDPADYGDGADRLSALLDALAAAAPETRLISFLNTGGDSLFLSDDGGSTVVLVGLPGGAAERQDAAERLRDAGTFHATAADTALRLSWTSATLVNDELREIGARDAEIAELRVLPLALAVLLLAFGSATASLTSLAVGLLTVVLARGVLSALAALLGDAAALSVLSANVAAMLGLGLAVDYSLLVISRFREELAQAPARADGTADGAWAAAATAAGAGRTVALSGLGVGIALAALLLVPVSEVRSIATAGLVVVATAVAVSATLLPTVLGVVGSRIDLLSPLRRRIEPLGERLWRGWGRVVFARPALLATLAAAPLLALALQAARLDISLPRGDWLPPSSRAAQAMTALERTGHAGLLQTVLVTAELGPDVAVGSDRAARGVAALSERLAADPRVAVVRTYPSAETVDRLLNPSAQDGGADATSNDSLATARSMFVSEDGHALVLAVVPRDALELHEISQLVRDLRAAPGIDGVETIGVGGAPALMADYTDAIAAWFGPVATLIVLATFGVLAIGLRSLLLPLKAVALNLLSVAAALGAMTLVFQDGHGAGLLGLPGASGAVFPIVPILAFAIVFGLSMDYEVFLFKRVVEAHREGQTDRAAMSTGLNATAGVITSAAALMVIVFGAFTMSEFLLMKMLGFTLAVAILIDAIVVRLALAPALFALAGRWNWWPSPARVRSAGRPTEVG